MDHQEVRDLLADAAIEPEGLDRLMAGDTPTAALVASHLAGCPDCAEELERLHRSVEIIRPTVRAVLPPELRERTLAYVAAVGRPRGPSAPTAAGPTHEELPVAMRRRAGSRPRLSVLAGLAAALVVAVTGTALLVNVNREAVIRGQSAEIEALGDVARWTARIDVRPDVQRIQLASATGDAPNGLLAFSPSSTELVVIADGLTPPAAGHEYRCWVEVGGRRSPIGKMFFGGDLAYWVGAVPLTAGLAPGARFGVSLVELGASDQPGQPVLVGTG
ncbi:MAG TPA: anti-sigma factor [Candidatus Limnocylindrales bacterium]|nr:anti-sigma factor [Candidatus Limnocylindrales bacterium]